MKKDKDNYYIKNVDLLVEINRWRETFKYNENGEIIFTGKMSDELGNMIMKIAFGLSRKPNFIGYTWIDDMIHEGILTTLKYLKSFDPEKSSNPFAYITTIMYNAFIAFLNQQKKHSKIKNALFDDFNLSINDQNGLTKTNYNERGNWD